jgi:hypothetical protein
MLRVPRVRNTPLAVAIALLGAGRALATDWNAIDTHDVIELVTRDADGDLRETPVWIAVVDGRGFVCTNDSRWFENLERDPAVVLRAGETEHPLRAEEIHDDALRDRVDEAFRAKYPWGRWLMELFGGTGGKHCLALGSHPAGL